jgi:hypothetical protein
MSRQVPPHCNRATAQADRDSPLAGRQRAEGQRSRRRSTGRAFTIAVDGLEPAQVLVQRSHQRRSRSVAP